MTLRWMAFADEATSGFVAVNIRLPGQDGMSAGRHLDKYKPPVAHLITLSVFADCQSTKESVQWTRRRR